MNKLIICQDQKSLTEWERLLETEKKFETYLPGHSNTLANFASIWLHNISEDGESVVLSFDDLESFYYHSKKTGEGKNCYLFSYIKEGKKTFLGFEESGTGNLEGKFKNIKSEFEVRLGRELMNK